MQAKETAWQNNANAVLTGFQDAARISRAVYFIYGDDTMIAVLRNGTTPDQRQQLIDLLNHMNLDVHISEGVGTTVLSLIGDTSHIDMDLLKSLDMVESVKRISEPYRWANRKMHPEDTIVEIGDPHKAGTTKLTCAILSVDDLERVLCGPHLTYFSPPLPLPCTWSA